MLSPTSTSFLLVLLVCSDVTAVVVVALVVVGNVVVCVTCDVIASFALLTVVNSGGYSSGVCLNR